MKKFLTAILTAVCLLAGVCFAGCNKPQTNNFVSYYGVVQTIEGSEGLYAYIPTVGVCELPSYKDGKQQDITIKEGDLLCMDFKAQEVEFMETYPVGIKTPVHTMTVQMENVELAQDENEYILTVDHTQELKNEFLAYEKGFQDTVYFRGSKGMPGTDTAGSMQTIYDYCTATVELTTESRLSLRLHLGEYTIQDFLMNFATRKIRISAVSLTSNEVLLENFFDLQKGLTVADIQKIETAEYFGSALPTYLRPSEYKTSATQEDIQAVYDWLMVLNNITLKEVPEEETYVDGGGETVLTVYTKLGNFRIRESAGGYLHIWDKHFARRTLQMPDIVGESVTYRFDYSTDETLNFYKWGAFSRTYDGKLSDIVFKIAKWNYDDMLDVGFTLEQDVGSFKLFSSKLFYHDSSGTYYEIVGDKDFSIIFDTNETLSEKDFENIQTLKAKYEEENNPYNNKAYVVNYYGEYASGAIVAMMTRTDMGYSEALWLEPIAGYLIQYNNGNRIIVLYNGEFCTLSRAYENGYLTEEDIADITRKHKVFYPYLYLEEAQ